ncbi:tRNA lysidine(34) synthetase TilS [Segnochrobactrum spirostomi]|uniref:tRNA(Ile)-lysidine synthase n=1 Tax=Segnochrobactrum spirostomi TaxID=2608987 RepID=A0A6A7Y2W4_9HYPH|nr:tRNA lysidine(34) synthetase TilS [Segnochrobactrum spirostomi]MQT12707.1 tRNA lysidine(34) synthetase TilS [Segnochrobactrum spirostomi]
MTGPAPVADDRLEALFAPLRGMPRVVLAVSGGSDSTALLVLYARWAALAADVPPALVATVDHALRAGSAAEATAVGRLAARFGLDHRVLVWTGEKPIADLQAAARDARYERLVEAARVAGAAAIVTAHTRDDVAETFLIRLGRGSGLAGLAAMGTRRRLDEIEHIRPFLALSREELRASLVAAGIGWVDDPSNEDPRFTRARVRRLMPGLAAEGLDAARLAATATRLARARAAIDWMVDRLARDALVVSPGGFFALDPAALQGAPEEVALRLFSRALTAAGGGWYGPRLDKLEAAFAAVTAPAAGDLRRTLAGAVVERRGGRLWIYREAGRAGLPEATLAPGRRIGWDGRFVVRLAAAASSPVVVRALGPGARARLAPLAEKVPAAALATVPAVWRDGHLVAAALPLAGDSGAGDSGEESSAVMFEPRFLWN